VIKKIEFFFWSELVRVMILKDLIKKKRSFILERWFDLILETYPPDTSKFLKRQKDPFANPVGNIIFQGIEGILNEIIEGLNQDKINTFLDNILRVRAVQDFSPSVAISFLFSLKDVFREAIKDETVKESLLEELLYLESRIDRIALSAFDIYMKCREKLYELKANELRNRTFRLLERANLIYRIPEGEKDIERENIEFIP
jgi:hypothetical protein